MRGQLLSSLLGLGRLLLTVGQSTNFSTYFDAVDFPDAQPENVSYHLNRAVEISSPDLIDLMTYRCVLSQRYIEVREGLGINGFVKPAQVFDGFYYIGQNAVSSWLIDTGEGLVIIDSLNNGDEAERILVPGIEAFGYNPADVKALLITHEHFDHYGGSQYMQQTYGIPIYASEIAWDGIESQRRDGPTRDRILEEGPFQLGNLTVNLIATPGHSPGSMSMIFNVADHGKEMMAAINGGAGTATNVTWRAEQIRSNEKLAAAIEEYNVTVLLANHPTQDRAIANLDILDARVCDGACGPNPFVVGVDAYQRYLRTMSHCVALQSARDGIDLDVETEDVASRVVRRSIGVEYECEH
jgi:hypothetical protein